MSFATLEEQLPKELQQQPEQREKETIEIGTECDLTLILPTYHIRVKKWMLSQRSEYFLTIFENDPTATEIEVQPPFTEKEDDYITFIRCLFTSSVSQLITDANVDQLLLLAVYHHCDELIAACEQHLLQLIPNRDVFQLLSLSEQYNLTKLKAACMQHLLPVDMLVSAIDNHLQQQPESHAEDTLCSCCSVFITARLHKYIDSVHAIISNCKNRNNNTAVLIMNQLMVTAMPVIRNLFDLVKRYNNENRPVLIHALESDIISLNQLCLEAFEPHY